MRRRIRVKHSKLLTTRNGCRWGMINLVRWFLTDLSPAPQSGVDAPLCRRTPNFTFGGDGYATIVIANFLECGG